MQTTVTNAATGFIVGGMPDPTYWAPENFKARYEKTAKHVDEELKIEEAARNDALNLEPASNTKEWTQTEQAIRTKCGNALTTEVDRLRSEVAMYEAEISKNSQLADEAHINGFFDNNRQVLADVVKEQMSANGSGPGAELIEALKDKDRLQREYNAFRSEHKRSEKARYPASTFWHYFIIALILIGEGLANSYFFGQGNDLGLLGGFLEALFFAAINVGFAGVVAFCLRYVFHRYSNKQVMGWLGVVFFTGIMVFVACVAALYRFQAANATDATEIGLLSLPWAQLGDAVATKDGILLILLALILGIVAVIDWFKMDDPYPGYGKRQRALEEVTDWIKGRQADAINEIHGSYVKRMREVEIPTLEQRLHILVTRAKNIEKVTVDYDQAIVKQLEDAYHSLLKKYRDENSFVRSNDTSGSSPPPSYFSDYPPLPPAQFNAAALAKQAMKWVEQFSHSQGYFERRKHEALSEKYIQQLKTVVIENFEPAVAQLQKEALLQNQQAANVGI